MATTLVLPLTNLIPQPKPHFTAEQKQAVKAAFGFNSVQVYEEEEVKERGIFGHYIYQPLQFDAFNYKNTDSKGTTRIYLNKLFMPIVMMRISRDKNMERTKVEGRDGTVKEMAGHDDYVIDVKGLFVTANGTYPKKERDGLLEFETANVAIPVSNPMLNDLLVFDVVIGPITWVPLEGVENAQAFEFTAYSDTNIQLKLQGEV